MTRDRALLMRSAVPRRGLDERCKQGPDAGGHNPAALLTAAAFVSLLFSAGLLMPML